MIKIKKIIFVTLVFLSLLFSLSVDAQGFGYGIKREKDHKRPYPGELYAEIISNNNGYYIGNDDKKVYLTFDVGYDEGNVLKILNVLEKLDVNATFFVTGHFLDTCEDVVRLISEKGHIVGNHTYNHPDITKISSDKIKDEVKLLESKYEEITGKTMPKYFRPPEGRFSEESLKVIDELGYTTVFWSLAYVDWLKDKKNGKEYAYNSVIDNLHNGAIILLHTVNDDNIDALEKIIIETRNCGYEFCSLNELRD